MKTKFFTFLLILLISNNLFSQNNKTRFFAMNYHQKILFIDFKQFEEHFNNPISFSNNARFHGMYFQSALMEHIIVGLYADGSLKDGKNEKGFSNWGGGLASVTIDYRIKIISSLFSGIGLGLGCGRFNYTSTTYDGTTNVSVFSDYIFIEPRLNFSYSIKNKLILSIESSYSLRINGNNYYINNTEFPAAFPQGLFLGASIGYQFPFLTN